MVLLWLALAAALGGVLVILLLVYRSALMPLLVITGALLALATACAVLYALARWDLLSIDGQITFVLVIGASTDDALLLIARFREELAKQPDTSTAMAAACRATAPPVLASAATIACAMMTLTVSSLPAEQAMGPAVAVAMVCCAAASLTFLPAALALCGHRTLRARSAPATVTRWTKITRPIAHRPRRVWLGCLVLLVAGAACAPLLSQTGIPCTRLCPSAHPRLPGTTSWHATSQPAPPAPSSSSPPPPGLPTCAAGSHRAPAWRPPQRDLPVPKGSCRSSRR
ncbi:MMPL family transporter [Streptomyces sp. NPDC015130]|uniref:MMPL family transporter n=1 Tax=Streptomyces sp. NPDC015130 TaxID=3364940 RepID=UPI0036F70701